MLIGFLKKTIKIACSFAILFFASIVSGQPHPDTIEAYVNPRDFLTTSQINQLVSHPGFQSAVRAQSGYAQDGSPIWWSGWDVQRDIVNGTDEMRAIAVARMPGCHNCMAADKAGRAFNDVAADPATSKLWQRALNEDPNALAAAKKQNQANLDAEKKGEEDQEEEKPEEDGEEEEEEDCEEAEQTVTDDVNKQAKQVAAKDRKEECERKKKEKEKKDAKEKKLEELSQEWHEYNPGLAVVEQQFQGLLDRAKIPADQALRIRSDTALAQERLMLEAGGDYDVLKDLGAYSRLGGEYQRVLENQISILNNPNPNVYQQAGQNVSKYEIVEQVARYTAHPDAHAQGGTPTCAWCKPTQKTLLERPSVFSDFQAQTLFDSPGRIDYVDRSGKTHIIPYEIMKPGAGELEWSPNSSFGFQSTAANAFISGTAYSNYGAGIFDRNGNFIDGATYHQVGGLDKFLGGDGSLGQYYTPTGLIEGHLSLAQAQQEIASGNRNIVVIGAPFAKSGGIQENHVTSVQGKWVLDANGQWQRVGAHVNTWKGQPENFVPIGQVDFTTAPGGGGVPSWAFEGIGSLLNGFPFFGGQNPFAGRAQQNPFQPKPSPTPPKNAKDKSIDSLGEDSSKKNINGFFEDRLKEPEVAANPDATVTASSNTSSTSSATATNVNGMFDETAAEAQGAAGRNTVAGASAQHNSSAVNQDGEPIVAPQAAPAVSSTPVPVSTPSETQGLEF